MHKIDRPDTKYAIVAVSGYTESYPADSSKANL
jgi:hypothetical protein